MNKDFTTGHAAFYPMPPGRDNIPATHPRRIAKLAATCSDEDLAHESEDVRRLVGEYRMAQVASYKEPSRPGPTIGTLEWELANAPATMLSPVALEVNGVKYVPITVLRDIKKTCVTATDGPAALAHIVRLCIDAGCTEHLDAL